MADPAMDRADLFREAVKTFVRVQAAKRLAALSATMQDDGPLTAKQIQQIKNAAPKKKSVL